MASALDDDFEFDRLFELWATEKKLKDWFAEGVNDQFIEDYEDYGWRPTEFLPGLDSLPNTP